MLMVIYSFLLALGLLLAAPWWLWRIARYRDGLAERLGFIPPEIPARVTGKRVVWVHAVSVGEVLAAERLIGELQAELGEGWVIAVSTTTATGQKLARERFPASPVFYFPLDFAFAVRAWLRVLRPHLMVLVESEFWPRHLVECERAGVPVAVVNARVSDRSFPRYMRLRRLWKPLLGKVSVFLAQGEETAERLRQIGAERVSVVGNLKYDLPPVKENSIARRIASLRGANRIVVAGSTHEGEEEMLLKAWPRVLRGAPDEILVLAPRHPQRFSSIIHLVQQSGFAWLRCAELQADTQLKGGMILVLDTIGDLAAVYGVASAAFIGGSLVAKGGHNPLEAARFGVPTIMGPHYENFREMVEGMEKAWGGPRIVEETHLSDALIESPRYGVSFGQRGRDFYESQAGATARTVDALLGLVEQPTKDVEP